MRKRDIFYTVGIILAIAIGTVNAATYIYASKDVSYNNNISKLESTDVQGAIDELNGKAEDYSRFNNKIWPVGSIYLSATDDTVEEVEERLGGTWVKLEGRFLLGASSSYTAGSTGGSADAIVVSHNHTFTGSSVKTDSQGAHTHTVSGTAASAGSHSHTLQIKSQDGKINTAQYGAYFSQGSNRGGINWGNSTTNGSPVIASGGAHTHSVSGTAASNGAHQHNVTAAGTISTTGSSGTGKNMPPYLVVYMYQRTA